MATDTDEFLDQLDAERRDIETMAENDEPEDDGDDVVVIEGSTGQLSLAVGGRKPDGSQFKLRAVEVAVEGQYTKGDMVHLHVIAVVDEIKFTDKRDEYGTVTATKRTHTARPISVERLPNPE